MSLRNDAYLFAYGAHAGAGQLRRYTNEPYIVHCSEVESLLVNVGINDDFVIAAALLHDVLEDTKVLPIELGNLFGHTVVTLVMEVTAPSKPEDGNRAVRKDMDLRHYAKASPEGQSIKLADMISNSRSIVQHDPKFARTYMKEKRALLGVLTDGDRDLHRMAQTLVDDYFANCSHPNRSFAGGCPDCRDPAY
jgi:(p)ppGpp synthase/HD superfamily hydrolase